MIGRRKLIRYQLHMWKLLLCSRSFLYSASSLRRWISVNLLLLVLAAVEFRLPKFNVKPFHVAFLPFM